MGKTIGEQVKTARLAMEWRQADLAILSKIPQGGISQIETGRLRPYGPQLARLEKALRIKLTS